MADLGLHTHAGVSIPVMQQIHGAEVKDVVTRFFYRDNHLCFEIILLVNSGERIPFECFGDYAEYKKAFADLLRKKGSRTVINLPKENKAARDAASNVA